MSKDERALQPDIGSVPRRKAAPVRRIALLLAVPGACLCALSLATDTGREGFSFSYLLGVSFLWAIVLGSLFFVALQHLTGSIWSVVIRRVAEMFAAPMWLVALLFVPVLLFAWHPASFPFFSWLDPSHAAAGHLTPAKQSYLSLPFFTARAVTFFAIWAGCAWFFVGRSLHQDKGGVSAGSAALLKKASAPFMPVFALTASFASFDWFMSLDPTWFSTIFGVYVFAGMVVSSLAAITLAVVWLRSRGCLGPDLITADHLYSLGGLIFAFSSFWAYIAFSQFMLIWYGNLAEEATYFVVRLGEGWARVGLVLIALRFVLPFGLLLGREAKMNPRRLVLVSVVVLAGQIVDLYWLIMPEHQPLSPAPGWADAGPLLLLAGALLWFVSSFMGKHPMVAASDPLFEQSRRFHL